MEAGEDPRAKDQKNNLQGFRAKTVTKIREERSGKNRRPVIWGRTRGETHKRAVQEGPIRPSKAKRKEIGQTRKRENRATSRILTAIVPGLNRVFKPRKERKFPGRRAGR